MSEPVSVWQRQAWRFSNFYFFYFCTVGIIVPYWSLYLQYLNFSASEIGELTAILVLTKVIAPNIWGAVADRVNLSQGHSFSMLRWATGVSLLIYLLMYLISPAIDGAATTGNFWWVAAILFGFSVFWNASIPQIEAATLNYLGGARHRYGSIRLWGSVGFILVVVGMGYVMDYTGPGVLLHAGALGFVLVFASSFLLSPQHSGASRDTTIVPLRQLLHKRVIIILVLCTLMQVSHAPFYTFFSIYLESYDYSKASIGWLWTIGVIFEIGVFMIGYRLLRHYRLTLLLSMTFLAAAVRWALLAHYPEQGWLVLMAQILHAITYGLHHSVMMQLIDQFFQGRYQVRGQALYISVSFGIGGALGSAASGYIWTGLGANVLFYSASVLMLLVSIVSVVSLSSRTEKIPIKSM